MVKTGVSSNRVRGTCEGAYLVVVYVVLFSSLFSLSRRLTLSKLDVWRIWSFALSSLEPVGAVLQHDGQKIIRHPVVLIFTEKREAILRLWVRSKVRLRMQQTR